MEIQAEGLEPGDKIRIRTPRLNPYLGILFTFGLPLIFFVAGFLIGNNFEDPQGSGSIAVLGGVIGLLTAFIATWAINRVLRPDEEPTVEKITSSS
jgi:ABC-type lipoprotein release transport system permease subunit